ncbi:FAD-binding oxidoreductase [Halomonas sp. I1]|uniref:NAD(P)/FAD-dependent oxidoreductase n=1 Tax=Halomonas sp. I1 TaxID=393536 RepID=UPI0028DFEBA0|nr:FAD-binding oxidoreductase [Halomonas sp. I1]MDT8894269.1 FAD-binding oxidoreductase [Halomonas sp. I1]
MTYPIAPSHQRPCGWNAWLPARDASPPAKDSMTAELVVVGAGYTGLAAARAWAEARPDDRVLVLDAERLGEGSPGRNSGFMLEVALAGDASTDELERMSKLNALSRQTMSRLRRQVEHHGIDCQLQHSGTYRAACTPGGMAALSRYQTFLEAAGLRYEQLGRPDLETRIGTDYYEAGLYSPDCYLVHPAALIRGLADALPDSVSLHEHSPAVSVHAECNGWRVNTPDAEIRAHQVILANNAYSRALGADASRVTAIYTYAAVTPVLPDALRARLIPDDWGLLPAHRLGCTLRSTPDGRLMIRSRYSYEREADNATIEASLADSLTRRYPSLTDIGLEHVWGGTTGLTHNGAPLWGTIQPGLHVSAGCNGGGIVKGSFLGDALARHALGQAVEPIQHLFGKAKWMPPEPLRRTGFRLISTLERRRAGLET